MHKGWSIGSQMWLGQNWRSRPKRCFQINAAAYKGKITLASRNATQMVVVIKIPVSVVSITGCDLLLATCFCSRVGSLHQAKLSYLSMGRLHSNWRFMYKVHWTSEVELSSINFDENIGLCWEIRVSFFGEINHHLPSKIDNYFFQKYTKETNPWRKVVFAHPWKGPESQL